ncbi:MAG: hypothetical protein BA873_11335 [Desulfobulbaceae bacterium C00003063]|nr:MAG: hypothetical protein BA873_11335 [Desulfobulbaceae bacterium C00003063]
MKMKKFLVLSTIMVLAISFLVWKLQPVPVGDIAAVVPDTALLYMEQKDVENFIDDLKHSKLGKIIQAIDFLIIGNDLKLTDDQLTAIQKTDILIRNNWDSEIIRELFGKQVALALLQPLKSTMHLNLIDFIKANTVLITEPGYKAEFMHMIAERYAVYSKNISISAHQYGKYHIKRISIDADILSTVAIDGFILMSFEEGQLRKCIDTFDNELPSLVEHEGYSRLRSYYSQPDQFMFLALRNSRDFITNDLLQHEFSGRDIIEKELTATAGFAGFSYGAWKNQSLISDRIMVLYNQEMVNSIVEKQLQTAPSTCDTLRFSPANPLVFYWTNTIDFELLYQLYSRRVGEQDIKLVKFAEILEDQVGMTINEFFKLLGTELSYIITSGQEGNSLSIPYGIMLFKVEEPERVAAALEKLVAGYNIPVKMNNYGSTSFYSWAGSPQEGLQPLYGFLDNYLFIGNSNYLVKQVIDSLQNGNNLLKDPRFLEIDLGLTRSNNYISYTDNVELITITKSLLKLAGAMMAIEDRDTALKVKIILRDIIDPLLDGLSMFDRTATRSYFTEDSVVIDSMTKVEN